MPSCFGCEPCSTFRDGPKDQTRNLEIPDSHFVRPGMTTTPAAKKRVYSSIGHRMAAIRRALLSPPLWGRVGKGGSREFGVCGSPPSLTLPHKGGGNASSAGERANP